MYLTLQAQVFLNSFLWPLIFDTLQYHNTNFQFFCDLQAQVFFFWYFPVGFDFWHFDNIITHFCNLWFVHIVYTVIVMFVIETACQSCLSWTVKHTFVIEFCDLWAQFSINVFLKALSGSRFPAGSRYFLACLYLRYFLRALISDTLTTSKHTLLWA